jgi:putative phosphoribosyl transferase
LGDYLARQRVGADLVLGLPRGGVIVAAEVAKVLQSPLDVLVVRKIGHPDFPEFAVGALSEQGVFVLDEAVLERARVNRAELEQVIAAESVRLREYEAKFTRPRRPARHGKAIIVVDDGLATGATVEAAVRALRQQGASRIVVTVPVASNSGAERVGRVCDQLYALLIDPTFQAVGQYYDHFAQVTDEEVQAALA